MLWVAERNLAGPDRSVKLLCLKVQEKALKPKNVCGQSPCFCEKLSHKNGCAMSLGQSKLKMVV